MARFDLPQLKHLAAGRWPDLLGLDHHILDTRHHPCPKCGGTDRFRALDDFQASGGLVCNQCHKPSGSNADGIASYAWLYSCSVAQAIEQLADKLGLAPLTASATGGNAGSKSPKASPKTVNQGGGTSKPAGTSKPTSKRSAESQFKLRPLPPSIAAIFAARKGGILAPSLAAVGAQLGNHFGANVIALPIRSATGATVGFTAANSTGGKITIHYPDGETETTSWKNVIDAKQKGIIGTNGLFTPGGRTACTRVYKTEGPSDLLALIPFLQPGEEAFCNPCGAGENPVNFPWLLEWLAGRTVIVVHDRDKAGVDGAMGDPARARLGWATWAAQSAEEVRNVELPYPLVDARGADLRQWIMEGGDRVGLDELVGSANLVGPPPAIQVEIGNYDTQIEVGDDGTERKIKVPIAIDTIVSQVKSEFGGWPKSVDGQLFHYDGTTAPRYFESTAALFGWMREQRTIRWGQGENLSTKDEFFSVMKQKAEKFLELQSYPHFPRIPDMYYTCSLDISPGDGSALNGFLDFFNPDHPLDRQLMMACVATLFWGGPPGQRPGWLVTSPLRQGAGKSSFSEKIAALAGGLFDFNTKADPDKDKTRLLSSEGASKRCARYDNIKAVRFSLSTLESLITSSSISGHRMYRGEGSRANYLTWFITMNDAELSRDLAQRCVTVSLGAPRRDGDWTLDINNYIEAHRSEIVADVAAFFARPINMVRNVNRWGSWVKDVLCRLDSPQDVFDLIQDREAKNDSDVIGADELNDYVSEKMRKLGYSYPDVVHIPNRLFSRWVSDSIGNNSRASASLKLARQFFDSGLLTELEPNPSRANGRGWIYRSNGCGDSQTLYDLEKRIHERNEKFENRRKKTYEENKSDDEENNFSDEEVPF